VNFIRIGPVLKSRVSSANVSTGNQKSPTFSLTVVKCAKRLPGEEQGLNIPQIAKILFRHSHELQSGSGLSDHLLHSLVIFEENDLAAFLIDTAFVPAPVELLDG
jgi:hypothetical protein